MPLANVPEIRFGALAPPVVAQRDITVDAPTSNQGGIRAPLEASSLAWSDQSRQLLLVSDRHEHGIFTCDVDLDAMTIGEPRLRVLIRNENLLIQDAESLTLRSTPAGGQRLYVLGSLSNSPSELPLPARRHMLRADLGTGERFSVESAVVLDVGSALRDALHTHFEALGVPPYLAWHNEPGCPGRNTYRWGNVEGMAFSPDGLHLLCGLRNPLWRGRALVAAVRGVDGAFGARRPQVIDLVDLFCLDLGERGVTDLCWDPVTQGYLLSAARSNGPKIDNDQPYPPSTLDSALFWWSGRKADPPVLFARVPDMNIDGICRLGDTPYIAIVSDVGDVSEMRPNRQSILTILRFAGLKRPGEGRP